MSLCIVENCNSEALIGAKKCHYHLHRNVPHLHLVGTEIEEPEHVCKLDPKKVNRLFAFAYRLRNMPDYTRQWSHEEILTEIERITESERAPVLYPIWYLGVFLVGVGLGSLFL